MRGKFVTAHRNVDSCVWNAAVPVLSVLGIAVIIFWLDGDLLDELSHVLTQCFTARPLALSVAVEGVGAGMLLVTVERDFHEIKH